MSLYGDKDILCELQGALLSAADAGENPAGNAVLGTANVAVPSVPCLMAFDLQQKGEGEKTS